MMFTFQGLSTYDKLPSLLTFQSIGQGACMMIEDSFIDNCLWYVINKIILAFL
jgi:hypothetical protein